MLVDEVRALAIEQVKFTNKDHEILVEEENAAYGEMHRAALEFEAVAKSEEIDPSPGAAALIKLAGKFGNQQPDITPDGATETSDIVKAIYGHANPAVEEKGEQLFTTGLDFIIKAKSLNKFNTEQGG